MEAQRLNASDHRTDHAAAPSAGDGARVTIVHLHGVPVPSRVFGFAATNWPSDSVAESESGKRRLTLLLAEEDRCARMIPERSKNLEVAAA